MNPESAICLFIGLFIIASLGAFIGLLTRNLIILLGIATLIGCFLMFHQYLPLPAEMQAEIHLFKARLGF